METHEKILRIIKYLRLKNGYSKEDLSKLSGVSRNTIASIEYMTHLPRIDSVVKLLEALDCEVIVRKKKKD